YEPTGSLQVPEDSNTPAAVVQGAEANSPLKTETLDNTKVVAELTEDKATSEVKESTAPITEQPKVSAPSYSTKRLKYVKTNGVPEEYSSLTQPVEATEGNLAEGAKLYKSRCALCHGEKGLGDGRAGKMLNPPASNLALLKEQSGVTDAYLYWVTNDGGKAIGSPMPGFKSSNDTENWKIVLFIRNSLSFQ
ncbi:MAG: cytochrome c, partial [Deltaproteobacteria bacterium]|nr:cytochrome c [Deltaproteobacteria bacterium]